MADLNFYQNTDGRKEPVKMGTLTVKKDGEMVWGKGTKDVVKSAVEQLNFESKPGTAGFLEEITMYLRNPYLWAAKAEQGAG